MSSGTAAAAPAQPIAKIRPRRGASAAREARPRVGLVAREREQERRGVGAIGLLQSAAQRRRGRAGDRERHGRPGGLAERRVRRREGPLDQLGQAGARRAAEVVERARRHGGTSSDAAAASSSSVAKPR